MIRTLALLLLLLVSAASLSRESVVGMSERVFTAIGEAQEKVDAGDYEAARKLLEELLAHKLSGYETAHALNLVGYTWYEQEQYERARESYERALAQPRIPDSLSASLLLTLGQICLVQEDYAEAEAYLRRLMGLPDHATPANKVLLANAMMGQERYEDALQPLLQAVHESELDGGQPRENWLSMLASVYYELGRFGQMREVVERLVALYPREQYLLNLAALHGQLGDTARQLALVESLADDRRLQQEAHLKMLASLLLAEGLPYKAAALMQRELETGRIGESVANLEMLSQAWYMAAEPERALPPLGRAAEMAPNGELYLQLARLHMDRYEWREADQAARAALARGGLRQEGHGWLLRGMAQVRLEQFTEAADFLHRAEDFEETRHYAEQWLAWIASEAERREGLGAKS